MLAQVDDVGKDRQQRLELSGQNVPAILWLTVILASVVTLGFCLIFGIKSAPLNYKMCIRDRFSTTRRAPSRPSPTSSPTFTARSSSMNGRVRSY